MELALEESGDVRIVRVKEAKLTYPVLSSFFAEVRQVIEGGARKVLIDLGVATEPELQTIQDEAEAEMDAAIEFGRQSPFPDKSELTKDVYVEAPRGAATDAPGSTPTPDPSQSGGAA